MQRMWTNRTLRAEDPSIMPPCWDTRGLFPLLHFYYYKCNADYVLHSKKQLAFPLQASVFILETRSESKRYRHWGENTPVHSGGGGQRRHSHAVSVVVLILDYRVDWDVTFNSLFLYSLPRLRLAKMNEEMREAEGPYSQSGQYNSNSPTEMQYRKCMQEFISLQLDESE